MNPVADALAHAENELTIVVSRLLAAGASHALSDDEVLSAMAAASRLVRLSEAVLIEAVAQAEQRSARPVVDERLTVTHGCRNLNELVQRTTLLSGRTVSETVRVARAVMQEVVPSTGEILPARYPAMRAAAAVGAVGLDGVGAVLTALDRVVCSESARLAADEELAASACGAGADGAPPPCADDLRNQATVWAMYLDQDGAEPHETRSMRKRGIILGMCRDQLVPVNGFVLPEVAGQLQRLWDSILNPKGHGPESPQGPYFHDSDSQDEEPFEGQADVRTAAQKRHDAFATILTVAARSGELPTIGGGAPTLVVETRAGDLASGRGHAHIDGCAEPVSLAVARQVACTGAVQRVALGENGRIAAISIVDRVFAAHQRKAISLRDGGCVIPGCHVSAAWSEIHHVEEASRGGPTHTDNGVLLCWYHHRTIDTGGWAVRMNHGVPEVRGPYWWDRSGQWRAVTKSSVRMRGQFRA